MTASGERIAHYRLLRKLGEGGMGEVHRAVDERLGRDVAIKLLPAHITQTESRTRLVREAQAAGQLNHPGIVTVHDVGIWRERVYVVMELVDGRSLTRAARDGIAPREALRLCAEAASALAEAHRRGILHRDIKPDNIMMTRDGRVKILDFGLAKLRAEAPVPDAEALATIEEDAGALDAAMVATAVATASGPSDPRLVTPAIDATLMSPSPLTPGSLESPWASLTFAGSLLGTPAYMSPEQAASEPLDARSEVYSLGLVLYELVTGKRPLVRDSVKETLEAARAADVPPLPAGAAPRPVARVLARALAHDPADRFADMDAMAAELRAAAAALAPRWRRRAAWMAGAAVVAGGAAAVALAAARENGGVPPRPSAADFTVRATRSITTDPGCEEYPAFTPDGREILFDGRVGRDTEILAITADGKTRRRLTHSPGWDIGATPSPDGRRVAYIHFTDTGRELRVMNIQGDEASPPITVGASRGFPAWAPDGALLYGDDSGRLFRVSLDRKPLRPEVIVELPPDHIAAYLAAYPDGEIAASVRSRAETTSIIRLGRARSGRPFELLEPPVTLSDCCNLRSDREGKGLYYVARNAGNYSILHWRPRGGGTPFPLDTVSTVHRGFDVAPGGDRIVVSGCSINGLLGRLDGGEFQPLPRFGIAWAPGRFDVVDPAWMVVSSTRSGQPQLWRLTVADGQADLLIESPSKSPALSPDGSRLAWAGVEEPSAGIHIRSLAGATNTRLTSDASDDQPAFSHDGRRLFFARTTAEGSRVFAVLADGSGEVAQVSPPGVVVFAASAERAQLAIVLADGDRTKLVVGPPGGPFETVVIPGVETIGLVAFAKGGQELLVSPRTNLLLAVTPGGKGEPRVVWSASDDTLQQVAVDRDGKLFAIISADEGDLELVDGSFR